MIHISYLQIQLWYEKLNQTRIKKTIKADINENIEESGIETDDNIRDSSAMKDETIAQFPPVEVLTMTEARRRLSSWERATTLLNKTLLTYWPS